MPRLVVLSEGLTGKTFEIKAEKSTLGRLEDNTICISEPSISSHHCEILLKGSDVFIKDLDSTNGTYINGERITESALKAGQILRLGHVQARLETGDPTQPKSVDKTMIITRGVKSELETGTKNVALDKDSPFRKKNNKVNMIFIVGGIGLGLVILGLVIFAVSQIQ